MHVVDDGAVEPVVLADRARPNRIDVDEQILRQLVEQIAPAQAQQGLMELNVGVRIFVDIGLDFLAFEAGEHLAQGGDLRVAGAQRDQPRRHAFQGRPDGDHLDDLGLGLAHDEGSLARHDAQKPLLREARHGLADGGPADPEVLGQLALVEADFLVAAIDVHGRDGVLQRLVRLRRQAEINLYGLDIQPGDGHGLSLVVTGFPGPGCDSGI